MMTKIQRDKKTIRFMIHLYCSHKAMTGEEQARLQELARYACQRLDHCRYGDEKPACKDCPVHCYAPAKRELMRQVMRWAGPRMLFYAPRATMRHLFQSLRSRF